MTYERRVGKEQHQGDKEKREKRGKKQSQERPPGQPIEEKQ